METQSNSNGAVGLRSHDWSSTACVVAGLLAVGLAVSGRFGGAAIALVVAIAAGAVARKQSLRHPGPMPYQAWWTLFLPRGGQSVGRLKRALEPRPGERILEIGPGVGIYSLPIARSLSPGGVLEVLDVQAEMLEHLARRARKAGVENIVPHRGVAARLPFADGSFDAAFLISVLGEIPDPVASLHELARVLKPGGRLVIGESVGDPDYSSPASVRAQASQAGLRLEEQIGPGFSYFARFRLTEAATEPRLRV